MSLTAEEQELFDFGTGALPPWFRDPARDMHIEAGMAKMAGAARAQTEYWFTQAYLTTAEGATASTPDWLQLHAIDRGTRRSAGESDDELRVRLRQYPDAVTREAILAIAQGIVYAAGVAGVVALLEPRRDRMFFVKNTPMSGTGGTFTDAAGNEFRFTPDGGWPRPPFRGVKLHPPLTHRLSILASAEAANESTFAITGLAGDAARFDHPTGVPVVDPTAQWQVDRANAVGHQITSNVGICDGFLSRGYRLGSLRNAIILILPYGTTAATAASVAEAVRQRKAAGFRVTVERRLNP